VTIKMSQHSVNFSYIFTRHTLYGPICCQQPQCTWHHAHTDSHKAYTAVLMWYKPTNCALRSMCLYCLLGRQFTTAIWSLLKWWKYLQLWSGTFSWK